MDEELNRVIRIMREFPACWCIAGGWAIDLFLGRITRKHGDVDLAIPRNDQAAIHDHFSGWTIQKAVQGVLHDWRADEWLSLPVHEIHVQSPGPEAMTIEFLLNEQDDGAWVFRRNPWVRLPLEELISVRNGLPILSPAVVLLYKAKNPGPHDRLDFEAVSESMDSGQRRWLREALARVHPGHEWINWLTPDRQ